MASTEGRSTSLSPLNNVNLSPHLMNAEMDENHEETSHGEEADSGTPTPLPMRQIECETQASTPSTLTASALRSAEKVARTNKKKAVKQAPIKKNVRVRIRRSKLYHLIPSQQQKYIPKDMENRAFLYGTVTGGSSRNGWTIKFDIFPSDELVKGLTRSKLQTLRPGDDEPKMDPKFEMYCHDEEEQIDKEKKTTSELTSEQEFCKQPKDTLMDAVSFCHTYNKEKSPIAWRILGDKEDLSGDEEFKKIREASTQGPEINKFLLQEMTNSSYHEVFLKHLWPDMTCFGKRMDEYYSDSRAKGFEMVKQRNIRFHDPSSEDPDWKIKQGLLLLIAAANEASVGVENFWKSGKGEGRSDYPDFGKYFDKNDFKAFAHAFPWMWSDKAYWYEDKRDVPWEMFLPFIESWNEKQRNLFKHLFIGILDESMIGWCPKTSKLGGLPNYTYEPRKPVPLGTMLRDTAEASTAIITYVDPVNLSEVQACKEFSRDLSIMPNSASGEFHQVHVAEVLRQAKNAGIPNGGWVCGDAWFGSVAACITLKKILGVNSTFVVKNNTTLFPKQPLLAVLKARHGDRLAGHWAVFTTVLEGVNLIALAYAWCDSNVSFFISTVGDTHAHDKPYTSYFEDAFGATGTKSVPRPVLADFVYMLLPTIDEDNKQRQSILRIEQKWPTKCCWKKLVNGFAGMSVVNQQRLYRFVYPNVMNKDVPVLLMADFISKGLKSRVRSLLPVPLRASAMPSTLKRVTDNGGRAVKELTDTQKTKHKRTVGVAKQLTCFVCKKYHPKYSYTSFTCKYCGTAICHMDRSKICVGRTMSCLSEHLNSGDPVIRCNGRKKAKFPKARRLWDQTEEAGEGDREMV